MGFSCPVVAKQSWALFRQQKPTRVYLPGSRNIEAGDARPAKNLGRVAEGLTSYSVVKRLLNHRNTTDPTERYAMPDNDRIYEALQSIELHMLMTAPELYNTLLASAKYQPLPTN